MDLAFTAEQDLLRATLRELLAQHSSPELVRALEDKPDGFRTELWHELAALDLTGLTVPEEHGGSAGSAVDLVVVCEELGRALAATPYLETCVLAPALLLAGGTPEQQATWLPRIAAGEAILTPAWYEPGAGDGATGVQLAATRDGDAWSLHGTKLRVAHGARADLLLVLARTAPGSVDVIAVSPAAPGVELRQTPVLGSGAEFEVTFDGARGELLGAEPGRGWAAFRAALAPVRVAVAAWAAGGARRALELTVDYARERHQFGRPIGSFQGLAHPIADVATELTGAEVLVRQAAWSLDTGRDPGPLPAMAKHWACAVFKRVTKVGQQVFGGIGFTRVIDIQLYFRRAKQLELTWGGPASLEEEIAAAELDANGAWVRFGAAV